jgi:hypothetical protein
MFAIIGNILKYSVLALTVIVLSHVIQIRGRTVSQHVEHSMNWIAGGPREVTRVTQELSSSVVGAFRERTSRVERAPDADITASDQKALNRLILRTQKK